MFSDKGRPGPSGQSDDTAEERLVETPEQGTVFVIDDDERICRTIKRVLESDNGNGFKVSCDCVNSVESAIQKIKEGYSPDVIFSDMKMPVMTGKDFYEWLKKERPDLEERILFMTGGVDDDEDLKEFVEKMDEQGRLFSKPDIISKIREVVEDVLCPN